MNLGKSLVCGTKLTVYWDIYTLHAVLNIWEWARDMSGATCTEMLGIGLRMIKANYYFHFSG